jgi:hypothetical protein
MKKSEREALLKAKWDEIHEEAAAPLSEVRRSGGWMYCTDTVTERFVAAVAANVVLRERLREVARSGATPGMFKSEKALEAFLRRSIDDDDRSVTFDPSYHEEEDVAPAFAKHGADYKVALRKAVLAALDDDEPKFRVVADALKTIVSDMEETAVTSFNARTAEPAEGAIERERERLETEA